MSRGRPATPAIARFWAKVEVNEVTGCWLWSGHVDAAGYARIHGPGRGSPVLYGHALIWEWCCGPVPEGLELDHLCRTRHCVNPAHLEPVPHRENFLRGSHPWAAIHRSGVCSRGHALTEENVYWRKDRPGAWNCKACDRLRRSYPGPAVD